MVSRIFLAASLFTLVIAGCVTPPDASVDAASVDSANSVSTHDSSQTFSHDGSIGVGAFACPAVICVGRTATQGERIFETSSTGTGDIMLTMDWSATNPNTERMTLGVFTCDPDECQSDADLSQIEYAYGPAPLEFSLEGFEIPEGETLYVFANVGPTYSGTGAWAAVSTPQEFHIDGTVVQIGSQVA